MKKSKRTQRDRSSLKIIRKLHEDNGKSTEGNDEAQVKEEWKLRTKKEARRKRSSIQKKLEAKLES